MGRFVSNFMLTSAVLLLMCTAFFASGEAAPCKCTKEHFPVCADGRTYANACLAKCAGFTAATWRAGSCGQNCRCTKEYRPVCVNGNTFSNSCLARCNGYTKWKQAICGSGCRCTKEYRLVCAPNGKTFLNKCNAECFGFSSYKPGYCALPAIKCDPGSATAKCKGDPCQVTTSTCKGNPKYVCVPNSCAKLTYLSVKLTGYMCKPIYVEPLTRTVVTSCLVH